MTIARFKPFSRSLAFHYAGVRRLRFDDSQMLFSYGFGVRGICSISEKAAMLLEQRQPKTMLFCARVHHFVHWK